MGRRLYGDCAEDDGVHSLLYVRLLSPVGVKSRHSLRYSSSTLKEHPGK